MIKKDIIAYVEKIRGKVIKYKRINKKYVEIKTEDGQEYEVFDFGKWALMFVKRG